MAANPASSSLYFHNALGRVMLVPNAYVCIEWNPAPTDSINLRAVYEHALNLLRRTGLTAILTDHRDMAPFLPTDRDWMTQSWVPRAVAEAGYAHTAIIQAHDHFNRLGTRHLVMSIGAGVLQVEYFDDPGAADAWLRGLRAAQSGPAPGPAGSG